MDDRYLLMDLERTLLAGVPCFWKITKYGYTYQIEFAGLFPKEIAEEIVKNDLDHRTVMISFEVIRNILGKDFKMHESY